MAVDLAAGGRLIEDMVRTLAFTAAARRLTLGGMDMDLAATLRRLRYAGRRAGAALRRVLEQGRLYHRTLLRLLRHAI